MESAEKGAEEGIIMTKKRKNQLKEQTMGAR